MAVGGRGDHSNGRVLLLQQWHSLGCCAPGWQSVGGVQNLPTLAGTLGGVAYLSEQPSAIFFKAAAQISAPDEIVVTEVAFEGAHSRGHSRGTAMPLLLSRP